MGRSVSLTKTTSGASVEEEVRCGPGEGSLGRGWRGPTDGVLVAEAELEAVGLAFVQRVVVKDLDVHRPLFEVLGGDKGDAWRGGLVQLCVCQWCSCQWTCKSNLRELLEHVSTLERKKRSMLSCCAPCPIASRLTPTYCGDL